LRDSSASIDDGNHFPDETGWHLVLQMRQQVAALSSIRQLMTLATSGYSELLLTIALKKIQSNQ